MKTIVAMLIEVIKRVVSFVPALIYEYVYSEFYTKYRGIKRRATYQRIGDKIRQLPSQPKHVLDVGTATGQPLHSIVDCFPSTARILGIDIDTNYLPSCKKIFADRPNV